MKKHRWHRRILKNQDPLVFSVGWRRFQSVPLYCLEDRSYRKRQLKYTPEHMHCLATFHGPVTPPNSGLIAFQVGQLPAQASPSWLGPNLRPPTNALVWQSLSAQQKTFRVAATGVVLELDQSFKVWPSSAIE